MSHHGYRSRHILSMALLVILISGLVFYGQRHGWLASASKTLETNQPGMYSINHFIPDFAI